MSSSKTTAFVQASLPSPSSSNVWSANNVHISPRHLQPFKPTKWVHSLLNLAVTSTISIHTPEFALQVLYLTHVWSNRDSGMIDTVDLLALAAALLMCVLCGIFHHNSGSHAISPNFSQPSSQRFLLDDNLTISWSSKKPSPSTKSYTQKPRCSNNAQQISHALTASIALPMRLPQTTFKMSQSIFTCTINQIGVAAGLLLCSHGDDSTISTNNQFQIFLQSSSSPREPLFSTLKLPLMSLRTVELVHSLCPSCIVSVRVFFYLSSDRQLSLLSFLKDPWLYHGRPNKNAWFLPAFFRRPSFRIQKSCGKNPHTVSNIHCCLGHSPSMPEDGRPLLL